MLLVQVQNSRVKREWLAGVNCFHLVFNLLDYGALQSQFYLKKGYVERNAALCLAVYRSDLDKIWFIDGATNIRATYDESAKTGKQRRYLEIPSNGDVPIRVTYEACFLDRDWLVPGEDAIWLSDRVARIARALATEQDQSAQISRLLDSVLPEYDDEDNGLLFGDSDSSGGGVGS